MTMTQAPRASFDVAPADVHATIARHMLADGYELVLDLDASVGSDLVDARDGTHYLDLFTFFASSALGMNHPALTSREALEELGRIAVNKPSNSDIYTVPMARFVETFGCIFAEANAVGTSVLAHPIGAAPEVLENPAQLVDCRDRAAVVDRLLRWRDEGLPLVKARPEFRLSAVVARWRELLER